MSHDAYRRNQQTTARPRDAEYLVFSKVTALLIAAEESGKDDLKSLGEAINKNRLLWGTLADDCAQETNLLPKETRASIISLHHFVQNWSHQVLRKGESLQPLIDLNRTIMDGLAGRKTAA